MSETNSPQRIRQMSVWSIPDLDRSQNQYSLNNSNIPLIDTETNELNDTSLVEPGPLNESLVRLDLSRPSFDKLKLPPESLTATEAPPELSAQSETPNESFFKLNSPRLSRVQPKSPRISIIKLKPPASPIVTPELPHKSLITPEAATRDPLSIPESPHESTDYWEAVSPCLHGLIFGALTSGLILVTILSLWLAPKYKTAVIITNEVPPGTIILFGGNLSLLVGSTHRWLLCDGKEVSRTTYSDLFYVIGTMYGVGNGNDTFNLPDFRARFPMGSNSSNDSQLASGGNPSHTLIVAELPAHSHTQGTLTTLASGVHTHSYTDPGHNHGGSTGSGPFSGGSFAMLSSGGSGNDVGAHSHTIPVGTTGITIQTSGSHTHTVQGTTDPVGLSQPFSLIPPYQTTHYIIRA